MFESIEIKNFKVFNNLTIKNLKQFNLFVGKNETGKTTVLEAIFLLINPNNPKLSININIFRELFDINPKFFKILFYKEKVNQSIVLNAKLINPNEKRKLTISSVERIEEVLAKEADIKNENRIFHYAKEDESQKMSEISTIKMIYEHVTDDGNIEKYYPKILKDDSNYKILPDEKYKEKLNGIFHQDASIIKNMVTRLGQVITEKKKKDIIKVLQKIEPLLIDIELGINNAINCDIKGFKELVPINILGRGLIKILSLIVSLICSKNGIVLIDEIGDGLHVHSQEILWSTIFKIAHELNIQIIATTHSYDCLRMYNKQYNNFSPKKDNLRLFRIERVNGHREIITYNHERLTSSMDFDMEVR